MKRVVCLAAFSIALFGASAQRAATPAFEAAVDFSASVKSLSEAAARAGDGPLESAGPKAFILYGTVASLTALDDGGTSVELISGEWQGDKAVRLYRVFVEFRDRRFAPFFDKESPDYCPAGTKLIVAARAPVVSAANSGGAANSGAAPVVTLAGLSLRSVR